MEIAALCSKYKVAHVINNAYGLYCTKISDELSNASKKGRVDLIISSTDKNFLVPVGGSLIYGPDVSVLNEIKTNYPGRASIGPLMDLFITLCEMGKTTYCELIKERKLIYEDLKGKVSKIAKCFDEKVIENKRNKISIAVTLRNVMKGKSAKESTFLGAMFFKRQVSGVKIIVPSPKKSVAGFDFLNYGCHSNSYELVPACVFAAAIGVTSKDVDGFCRMLVEILSEVSGKKVKVKDLNLLTVGNGLKICKENEFELNCN